MTQHAGFDFTKFVPGFDFLKNLTPGGAAASAASTAAPGWVAPTLDPEELEKRIQELKTVQFWLEQNAKAVGATIQALEVQRMTLATLKGMNMSFNDLAESLKVKPQATAAASPFAFTPAPEPEPEPQAATAPEPEVKPDPQPEVGAAKAAGIDPAHWWGALTDQFQNIAKHAMTDMAQRASAHASAGATKSAKTTNEPKAKSKPAAKRVRKPAVKRASAATTAAKPAAKRSSKPAAR